MRVGLLLFSLCLPMFVSAQSTDDYGRLRLKHANWFGLGISTGRLEAIGDNATSKIRLTALPRVQFGFERWADESIGVAVSAQLGVPANIDNVLGNTVRFSRHRLTAGTTYRYFLGPRPLASALTISSLLHASVEDVQERQPAVILSRFIISPTLGFGYERFIWQETTWMRAGIGIGYPFFVRETPSDSGRPDSMFDVRVYGTLCHYLTDRWGLGIDLEHLIQDLTHRGEATRAGGINDVKVRDSYTSASLHVRYVPEH